MGGKKAVDNAVNNVDDIRINWKQSIRTKLIVLLLLLTIIPLSVANLINYFSATNKAYEDTVNSKTWEASYIAAKMDAIIKENYRMLETIAAAPTTTMYMQYPVNKVYEVNALSYLEAADARMNDGNVTVLTGPDGMQLLRSTGKLVDVHERDYFKEGMAGNHYCSDVIVSASTGLRICTISAPVYGDTGSVIGIVQRNFELKNFHEFLKEESDDAFIADRKGLVAAHSQYEITADNEDDRSQSEFMTSGKDEGYYTVDSGKGYYALLAYVTVPSNNWKVCAATDSKTIDDAARRSAVFGEMVGFIMTVIAAIISILGARNFVMPIMHVNKSLHALADGRFRKIDKYADRKDEFGQMVNNTNSVIDSLEEIVSSIKRTAAEVGDSSRDLSDTASQISRTADDVSNAVQEIASGAAKQADEIQSANSSVNSIGEAVVDVQTSSNNLSELADKMKEASEHSSESLLSLQNSSNEMTNKIDDISNTIQATQDAVSNINEKVEGITSIATQTNLLSLNASIEAARAGEAGKGFAVVAEEIGKLAEDSKKMADDIRVEMDILLNQSKAAVDAAELVKQGNINQQVALGETSEAVNGMLGDIDSTVDGVQLISKGADTCESSKNTVVDNMSALSAISEENAASAEETGASMEELSATVTVLAESASQLNTIAEKLVTKMAFFKA